MKIENEVHIDNTVYSIVNRVKLLDVNTDDILDFDYYMSEICKKASKKLYSLCGVC